MCILDRETHKRTAMDVVYMSETNPYLVGFITDAFSSKHSKEANKARRDDAYHATKDYFSGFIPKQLKKIMTTKKTKKDAQSPAPITPTI